MRWLWLMAFAFVILLSACEEDSRVEPALWMDRNAMDTHLYYNTFEYSMVKLRYMDERGDQYTFALQKDMLVEEPKLRKGPNQLHVQYRNAELRFEISLGTEPTTRFWFVFNGIDTLRGNMFFSTTEAIDVPVSQNLCTIPDYTPPKLDHYEFSHIEPTIDQEFTCHETHTFTIHYEPNIYEISFFDHKGELIETIDILYNDSIADYRHAFPHYIHFNSWDQDLNYIRESKEVHPSIVWTTYHVLYHNYEESAIFSEHVKHGHAASPPIPPKREGYEFIKWDQSLDEVTEALNVYPIYERLLNVTDPLDEANTLDNYTISVEWKNIPYEDGSVTHRFKVDGNNVSADYFGDFFLIIEEEKTFIIDTYEFDDHENWYKMEHIGDDVVTMLGADVLSIDESMLNYAFTHYTLDSAYYEDVFGADYEEVTHVRITLEEGVLYINVEWANYVQAVFAIYDIGSTEFELPEYIDET